MMASGATALFSGVHWSGLKELHIDSNSLGNEGLAALAAARLPCLEVLWLSDNRLCAGGLAALTRASWKHLKELYLHENKLGAVGARRWPRQISPALISLIFRPMSCVMRQRSRWPQPHAGPASCI